MTPPFRDRRSRWLLAGVGLLMMGFFFARRGADVSSFVKRDEGVASPSLAGAATPRLQKYSAVAAVPAFSRDALFAFANPANAPELDGALPAPAREIHYVRLNAALIAGAESPFGRAPGAGRVELPLPEGSSLAVVIDATETLGPERFTSTGHIEGRPDSRAIFAYNRGFLHAAIDDGERGSFALRAATSEFAQFYQIDPAFVAPCGGERHPSIVDRASTVASVPRQRSAETPAASAGSSTLDSVSTVNATAASVDVHVMIVYTQAVLPTLSGAERAAALQSAFDATIARVNSAFAASLISTRVKLVRIAETTYSRDGPTNGSVTNFQDDALTALQSATDGQMDEIHTLRNQCGADLVCLALNRPDASSSGLSFLLDTPGDRSNAAFGFSVAQYTYFGTTDVVPHELGHGFGCAHDRPNAVVPGAFSYSYGYTFTGSDSRRYHDIMAYPPGTGLSYFSNPMIDAPRPAPAGSPGGIAVGQAGESDCARSIENTAAEVASFRPAVFAIIAQPVSQSVGVGTSAVITAEATTPNGGPVPAYQWQLNGSNLTGATGASLVLSTVQPANTGLYAAVVSAGTTSTSDAAILGLTSTSKVVGAGAEILSNRFVPSVGNTFDQILLQGAAATITADTGQVTRLSYVDLNDDIVQVEFSGAGALSLLLDAASGPAAPANYNQAGVSYMKGHAGIVISGANETTNLSVFSVGRLTAIDPTLFFGDVTYDGVADLAFVAILSANGKFGGLRTANASYFAAKGLTGVYAPSVAFQGPVFVGDINASDAATAVLMIGSSSDTRVAGGDLLQSNGRPMRVSGLKQLKFVSGTTSQGVTLSAQANKAVLQQNGADVTAQIVVNPAP